MTEQEKRERKRKVYEIKILHGAYYKQLRTWSRKPCYLFKEGRETYTLYIPSDIHYLNKQDEFGQMDFKGFEFDPYYKDSLLFTPYFTKEFIGAKYVHLKVFGGEGLRSTEAMFMNCVFDVLDLTEFDTRNVTNAVDMFRNCTIGGELKTGGLFDTSKVRYMNGMFQSFYCDKQLNLADIRMDKVIMTMSMFEGFKGGSVILKGIKAPNLRLADRMFKNYEWGEQIDISDLTFEKLERAEDMFEECSIRGAIVIENKQMNELTDASCMFIGVQADKIVFKNNKMPRLKQATSMFMECQAKKIILSGTRLGKVRIHNRMNLFEGCKSKIIYDRTLPRWERYE